MLVFSKLDDMKHKEKQENIRRYILELIIDRKKGIAGKTSAAFGISEMTVYRYLKSMQEEGIIIKSDNGYELQRETKTCKIRLKKQDRVEEEEVYRKAVEPYVKGLPVNARGIWEYCFSEMMNNAIDHSEADTVTIVLSRDYINTSVAIIDDGIGIFRKIREYFGYHDTDEVIEELFKGKLTTDAANHSGEGIFFTSRIMDSFAAISDQTVFSHDKYDDWKSGISDHPQLTDVEELKHGTTILMRLSNYTKKTAKEVFDKYADIDGGFTKTRIPLKNIYETYPVSRSQAKRLCHRFESFEEIVLDFEGVDEMGQGFAHELFIKFGRLHPEIILTLVNTNRDVERMIHHVVCREAEATKTDVSMLEERIRIQK